jgi:prefoldin subunit 5
MSQTPNKFDSDVAAIQLFNDLKEAFSKQVKALNELKREVTKTDCID